MRDDYGYFGKGTTGYVHFMETFNRNNSGGKKPHGKNGCLTTLLIMIVVVFFIHLL